MRLFFAIMLPEALQQHLSALKGKLAWLPIHGTWPTQHNLHITLKFLGEVPDDAVTALADAAAKIPFAPFELQPDHLVLFPESGPARVLGLGFTGDVPALCQLAADLEEACAVQGIPREERPFKDHATLARFRDGLHQKHRPRILETAGRLDHLPAFQVDQFQLIQSQLGPAGSTYAITARFTARNA
jgi:2'-5' RNA ligase